MAYVPARESEKILALRSPVVRHDSGVWQRLAYVLTHPFSSQDYGHLLLTNRRVAFLRSVKGATERESGSPLVAWEGYSTEDLVLDLTRRENLEMPLEGIRSVQTTGKTGLVLKVEVETAKGFSGHLFAEIAGRLESRFGSTPVTSGASMTDFADAIRQAKAGVG